METRRLPFLSGNGLGHSDLNQGFSVGSGRLHGGWTLRAGKGSRPEQEGTLFHQDPGRVQGVSQEVVER